MKQLLFTFALISTTALHSMELTLVYPTEYPHATEAFNHLNTHICSINQWYPKQTKDDILAFSRTNKFVYAYYYIEEVQQNIVRQMAIRNKVNDHSMAKFFGYKPIASCILHLFNAINDPQEFAQYNLKNTWYLNSTAMTCHTNYQNQIYQNRNTLLLDAIRKGDFAKAKQLCDAGINCNNTRCPDNPLALLIAHFTERPLGKEILTQEDYLTIIKFLLNNNVHPDSRNNNNYPTLLHIAVAFNNQNVASLALEHGANPYATHDNFNAFDLEKKYNPTESWLANMINEINQSKK